MDQLPVLVLRKYIAKRGDKIPLCDQICDGKVWRLLGRFKIPANGIFTLKGLVSDILPFVSSVQKDKKSFVVASSDSRVCLL